LLEISHVGLSLFLSPTSPAVRWRAGVGAGEVIECHFGGVFLRVVEVLAVVPESCGEGASVNRYSTGPSSATTTSVRDDLEDRGQDVGLATGILETLLPGSSLAVVRRRHGRTSRVGLVGVHVVQYCCRSDKECLELGYSDRKSVRAGKILLVFVLESVGIAEMSRQSIATLGRSYSRIRSAVKRMGIFPLE